MNDLISRQAAIRWVKTECNPYGRPTIDFESGVKVIEHLEKMQSAQQWIPVSERLPEEGKEVLVTVWGRCEIASFYALNGLQEWKFDDFSLDNEGFADVTAWMPLPEVFKGGAE